MKSHLKFLRSRLAQGHLFAWVLLILAGSMIYVVFEEWWKGLLLVFGSILLDIGIDMIILDVERIEEGKEPY